MKKKLRCVLSIRTIVSYINNSGNDEFTHFECRYSADDYCDCRGTGKHYTMSLIIDSANITLLNIDFL
jgi:hypothetical protein